MPSSLSAIDPYLVERYLAIKAAHPGEGRRKWRLRVVDEFWELAKNEKDQALSRIVSIDEGNAAFEMDDDPFDDVAGEDASGIGIILRTDFSNEHAWQYFTAKLREGEGEFAADNSAIDQDGEDAIDQDPRASSSAAVPQPDESDSEDESFVSAPIFTVVNPASTSSLVPLLNGVSNLTALRLFNDVTVRRAPALPADIKRQSPPHRLIDYDEWQEAYEGKMVWIYDLKSNVDGCVRVISQAGGAYGTATADSWRARVTHISELQVNLASGAMSIDFGGLDRYDYEERLRNLREAVQGVI